MNAISQDIIRVNVPNQRRDNKRRRKVLKATWDDSSSSEEDEPTNTKQVAHYTLMAIGDEKNRR